MKILVDECLFAQIVDRLRLLGHDVTWARQDCPGLGDDELLARATAGERILVTEDRDFGELTVRLQRPAVGIVIAAVSEFDNTLDAIASRIADAIHNLDVGCIGYLTTIEPGRIRQRRLDNTGA